MSGEPDDWEDIPTHLDDEFTGLSDLIYAFEDLIGAQDLIEGDEGFRFRHSDVDDMGYREAKALYIASLALSWFFNYGEGYYRHIEALQYTLADRVDGDPYDDVVRLV